MDLCFAGTGLSVFRTQGLAVSTTGSRRVRVSRTGSVRRCSEVEGKVDTGGGDGTGGSSGGNGKGGDDNRKWEGSGGEGMEELVKFAAATSTNLDKAFASGSIPASAVINYMKCVGNPIKRLFLRLMPWTLSRVLADELFWFKVAVEEGLGIFGKMSAEFEQRRDRFAGEIDFVLCNLLTAFLVDFALVYLPAPSIPLSGEAENWFNNLNKRLPSSIFVQGNYTLMQRAQGYLWTASKLFAVGFACCFFSAVMTNSIIYVRSQLDPNFVPANEMQNPFSVSAMYATFLGLSSSTRYQIVNGIEIHLLPALLGRFPLFFTEAATLGIRFGNTFWGSQQWVMFAKITGVQKAGD